MTIYRRNPLLMTVMGANPGRRRYRPSSGGSTEYLVIDPEDGRIVRRFLYVIGDASGPRSAQRLAQMLSEERQRPFLTYWDFGKNYVGMDFVPQDVVQGLLRRDESWRDFYKSWQKAPYWNPLGEAILAGATSAIVSSALQSNPHLEDHQCAFCGGSLAFQGTLGNREHYRCRNCGNDCSTPVARAPRPRRYRKLCIHGEITNRCRSCRGRKMTAARRACIHGTADATRCVQCLKHQRPGGPVRNNPAIRSEWDRLTNRKRLAVLEFAGIEYEQARRLAHRPWGTLPPSIQDEVAKGWRDTTMRKRELVQANPGPRGKRRMTITVEQFAAWVKRQRDPRMWKAFLAKFRGYEKWTHGARARKVHLEWVDTPGVDGLWITYDGGKQPESTYIMPKGSPRKGAWKHPWDTMPDIKHDPQAGIVLTKLRGRSKITDFYHR